MFPTKSLARLICERFDCLSTTPVFAEVFVATAHYITKGIKAFEYQDHIREACEETSFSAKDFRMELCAREYMILNMKMYFLRLGKEKKFKTKEALEWAREYDILKCDARICVTLFQVSKRLRKHLVKTAKPLSIETHLNLLVVRATLNKILPIILPAVKRRTQRKLRFIVEHHNIEFCDFHSELMFKVVQAYYRLMPAVMSPAHVLNYLRRAQKNYSVNIIKSYTTQRRGRFVNNAPGDKIKHSFSNLEQNESQLNFRRGEDAKVSIDDLGSVDTRETIELNLSIARILKGVRTGSKRYLFLTILMGHEDPGFSAWLRAKGRIKADETHADLQARASTASFNILVSRYLRIPSIRAELLLTELRNRFDSRGIEREHTARLAA